MSAEKIVSRDPGRDALDAGNLRDRGRQRLGHKVVFDVPPEGFEPDLAAWNSTGRGGKNPPVSSMRRNERKGSARDCKLAHKPRESRKATDWSSRATVRPSPRSFSRAAADDVEAGLGQTEGRAQPREPRARDQNVRADPERLIAVGHRRSPRTVSLLAPMAQLYDPEDGAVQV